MKEIVKSNISKIINPIHQIAIQSLLDGIEEKKYSEVFHGLKKRNILLSSKQKISLLEKAIEKNDFVFMKMFLTGEVYLQDDLKKIDKYASDDYLLAAKSKITDMALENQNFNLLKYMLSGRYQLVIQGKPMELKDSQILDLDFNYRAITNPQKLDIQLNETKNKKSIQQFTNESNGLKSEEKKYHIEEVLKKIMVKYPYEEGRFHFFRHVLDYIFTGMTPDGEKDIVTLPDMYKKYDVSSPKINMTKILFYLAYSNISKDDSSLLFNDSICQMVLKKIKSDKKEDVVLQQIKDYNIAPHMTELSQLQPLLEKELKKQFQALDKTVEVKEKKKLENKV